MKERVKSVSDLCSRARTIKDIGRKTEFKVTPGEGIKIVSCYTREMSNSDT